jgi:DNA-binding NarL/FixJ family response regulator
VRVLVVNACSIYRHALVAALAAEPRVRACAGVADLAEALRMQADGWAPDILLSDTGTAPVHGLAALRDLVDGAGRAPVIAMLGRGADPEAIVHANSGASGFVNFDDSFADLVDLMTAIVGGGSDCAQRVAATLLRTVAILVADRANRVIPPNLTPREHEVLELLEVGLSNKQIATRLTIELRTVKNHVHNILGKFQVSHRQEAAARFRAARMNAPARS